MVTSLEVETPWNPATITTLPSPRASLIRPARTSRMRALPCRVSVMIPAWEPVNDLAVTPRSAMAMASSDMEMRSPAVSSMSISRGGGSGETLRASAIRWSVVSPMAETTTTTSLPAWREATMRSATRRIREASPTEVPPYFWTTRDMTFLARAGDGRVQPTNPRGPPCPDAQPQPDRDTERWVPGRTHARRQDPRPQLRHAPPKLEPPALLVPWQATLTDLKAAGVRLG